MRISDWSSDVCSSDLKGGMRSGVLSERPVTTMTSFPAVRSNLPPFADTCCADAIAGSMTRAPKVGRRLILKLARSLNALTAHSRSEEHTSELQSLMRISYAVFCLKKKTNQNI